MVRHISCNTDELEKFGRNDKPRITQSGQPQPQGGWKNREKSQGNVCQGNNPENALSHSPDNHSPDFAWGNVFNRVGGAKILAKMSDSDGLHYQRI
jgi:hypothetical protein